jgi:hypothetical protein
LIPKSLFPLIAKYVTTSMPKSEEEAITKEKHFDLIYSQSSYLYMMLPDAPRPQPFGQEKPGTSQSIKRLIKSMTHFNPYSIHTPHYNTINQYNNPYGETPCYPPTTGTPYAPISPFHTLTLIICFIYIYIYIYI